MTEAGHRAVKQAQELFQSQRKLAQMLGISRTTVQNWLDKSVGALDYSRVSVTDEEVTRRLLDASYDLGQDDGYEEGLNDEPDVPPNEEYNRRSDGKLSTIRNIGEPVYSEEQAAEFFDIDTSVWTAEKIECGQHEVPMKLKTNDTMEVNGTDRLVSREEGVKVRCYRLNVTWRRDGARESVLAMVDSLYDEDEPVAKEPPSVQRVGGAVASAIHIPDLHLGNLIVAEDGTPAWDLDIGADAFRSAYATLLDRALARNARKIILPVGSDAAHVNSSKHKSANGTQYSQVYPAAHCARRMRDLYEWAIDYTVDQGLAVQAVGAYGNHDWDIATSLADTLHRQYRDYEQVSVDRRLTPYKMLRWGENLIGITHGKNKDGHLLSAQDLYEVMADRAGSDWHETTCKEWLTGHLHSKDAERVGDYAEHNDVVVRVSPTLCPPDGWHLRNGYLGALRAAEVWHYHESEGMIGMDHYIPQRSRAA
jgi:hypothetical protein